ncbi:MAG: divergent PAP2 family protein [Erysipelotrichaceae bacterium]|nr:divergent PAP2 family protein [Erysipelotrichaceae bacterium]
MLDRMYPFYSAIIALVIAQILKPLIVYVFHREWKPILLLASGGMPSSHSALVSALCLSVGLIEKFSSTMFAITLVFSLVILFDACNVRYYAGQNITLTKKLIDDLVELGNLKIDDPIYHKKMKEVLGHTYLEVLGGIIVGLATSYIYYLIFVGR